MDDDATCAAIITGGVEFVERKSIVSRMQLDQTGNSVRHRFATLPHGMHAW